MASIELCDFSISFDMRAKRKVPLKHFLLEGLFMRKRDPANRIKALQNINLKLQDGDRLGIIGHNGAGKSTLLKALAGVYPPRRGTRTVDGRISSLFEITVGFEPDANGWENIAYRSYLQGETPKTVKEKVQEIADFTELGEFLNSPVRYYSSGMSVRLAFAIATSIDPEILLLDEVLSAGDISFQHKARRRMEQMMDRARLMVLVSHDLTSTRELCNRAIWLDHGRIRMEGSPREVIKAYESAMKLGCSPGAEIGHAA